MRREALIALVALTFLSGCGESGKTYTLAPFRDCVSGAGYALSSTDGDIIALDAPGGGGGITFAHNFVSVGFERTAKDASGEVNAGSLFGGDGAKLYSIGNVYVSWDNTPTSEEKQVIDGCVS